MKAGARLLALLFGVGLLFLVVKGWRPSVSAERDRSPALRGEGVARRMGCFACHGPGGVGGVFDPLRPVAGIPGWAGGVLQSYARDEAEVRAWIEKGVPPRLAHRPPEARSAGLTPMPAYEARLSARERDDLLAYVLAVALWDDDLPEAAFEGRALAHRLGCFGCHGPSGIGGVSNPGSFKGVIPAWDGEWFADLVRDDAEFRAWILDGRPPRLAEHPLARRYLDGQVIQMPAYRAILSDAEIDLLLAYVRWLRREAS